MSSKSTATIVAFQLTAARRRLAVPITDARPKIFGFNSQPPEGGWFLWLTRFALKASFNSQPPEGGWVGRAMGEIMGEMFQLTAARRRLGRRFFKRGAG